VSAARFDIRALPRPALAATLRRTATRATSGPLTAAVTWPIARMDARQTGYALARAGAWGLVAQRKIESSHTKEPLAAAASRCARRPGPRGSLTTSSDWRSHAFRAPQTGSTAYSGTATLGLDCPDRPAPRGAFVQADRCCGGSAPGCMI